MFCQRICSPATTGPIVSDADYGNTWAEPVNEVAPIATESIIQPVYSGPVYSTAPPAPMFSTAAPEAFSTIASPAYEIPVDGMAGLPCCPDPYDMGGEIIDDAVVEEVEEGATPKRKNYITQVETNEQFRNLLKKDPKKRTLVQFYDSSKNQNLNTKVLSRVAKEHRKKTNVVSVDLALVPEAADELEKDLDEKRPIYLAYKSDGKLIRKSEKRTKSAQKLKDWGQRHYTS